MADASEVTDVPDNVSDDGMDTDDALIVEALKIKDPSKELASEDDNTVIT